MLDSGPFWWTLASLGAVVFCIARAVEDLRHRRYAWAVLGIVSALILLLTPVQTHAVKIDLPAPAR